MALVAYIDDSGSDTGSPVYVLGGLMLPEEIWDGPVTGDWKHVLSSAPAIEYFKGSEVWDRRKGPFAEFTTNERTAKVDALTDVVGTYCPMAISCRIEWPVFRAFQQAVALDSEIDDPYFFLFLCTDSANGCAWHGREKVPGGEFYF